MIDSQAPAAYIATVTAFDAHTVGALGAPVRPAELDALNGLTIPIPLVSPSPLAPCVQAELVIQITIGKLLIGRIVAAALWRRDRDLGSISVWHDGQMVPFATVELTPTREAVSA